MTFRTAFRKTLFWSHLGAGVSAGLVILTMSITGLLLTYERQIIGWVDSGYALSCTADCRRLPADDMHAAAASATGSDTPSITLFRDARRPVLARAGRGSGVLLDPYDGSVLRDGASSAEHFFSVVTGIHRWLALEGDARSAGRAVTGYSNLLFLFLLLSGTYLWLPRVWNRAMLRTRVLFNPRAKTGKARDFNWHHVFAFWAVIPLFVIITTATVFYFPWSNELVYAAYGESPPERGREPEKARATSGGSTDKESLLQSALASTPANGMEDWKSVTMRFLDTGAPATFSFDRSMGGQPSEVVSVDVDSDARTITAVNTFADRTPGRQARATIRFLHTGEVLGVAGQTIAGLASLAACLLVWTGLALAWRRLIQPLIVRRASLVAGTIGE